MIPTTWQFDNAPAISTSAVVTIPAPAAGIRRVISHLKASFINIRGDATNIFVTIQIAVPVAGIIFSWPMETNSPAGGFDVAEFDEEIIKIGEPGSLVTVQFNAGAVANCVQAIMVQGYDQ